MGKKLLFSTTILLILYPRSMVPPTTKHSPGCIVPSHFLYYVLLCWLFEGAESCSHQSILLSPLNCIWWRAESANYNSVYTFAVLLCLFVIISYNTLTAVQYTDIALTAVLCSIAQVLMAKTTTIPHQIGGKTLHRSLEFFYSLT